MKCKYSKGRRQFSGRTVIDVNQLEYEYLVKKTQPDNYLLKKKTGHSKAIQNCYKEEIILQYQKKRLVN